MNKNHNPFSSYLACINLIKAAQMFFCVGNRGQMRLAFLCKDKASQSGALKPRDEEVHPTGHGAGVDIWGLEPMDPEISCKEVP